MALLTQSKFAKLAGVSRQTVIVDSKKKPPKVIIEKNTKIDTDHPTNKAYIEELVRNPKVGKKYKKKENPLEALTENLKELKRHNDIIENFQSVDDLEKKKLEQEIKLKTEQTLQIQQKRIAQLEILILKAEVDKRLSKLGQGIKTHLLTVPRKVAPRLVAMVKSGSSVAEIEKAIAEEIEKAMMNAKVNK